MGPVSIVPTSGNTSSATFTFSYSFTDDYRDIAWTEAQIGGNPTNPTDAKGIRTCRIHYDRVAQELSLLDDTGTMWIGPAAVGAGGSLSNSQCSVNTGWSAAYSGTSLTLNVPITFMESFAGPRQTYLRVKQYGAVAAWSQLGGWNVP